MAFAALSFCTCRGSAVIPDICTRLKNWAWDKSASSALSACLTVQFPVQSFNSRASSPRRIWNFHLARSSGRAEERAGVQICICGAISYFALVPPQTQNRTKRVCEGSSLPATPPPSRLLAPGRTTKHGTLKKARTGAASLSARRRRSRRAVPALAGGRKTSRN